MHCEQCGCDVQILNTSCELKQICDDCFYSDCPSDCDNFDFGNCPRCFVSRGIGCDHGPLCFDCREEIERMIAEQSCDVCHQPLGMDDAQQFVIDGASWASPVPACHLDCAEREDRDS